MSFKGRRTHRGENTNFSSLKRIHHSHSGRIKLSKGLTPEQHRRLADYHDDQYDKHYKRADRSLRLIESVGHRGGEVMPHAANYQRSIRNAISHRQASRYHDSEARKKGA